MFAAEDPFAGVDLDGCLDPESGELHPAAGEILARLGGYQECSPSGTGMHAIVIASLPGGTGRETKQTPWTHEDRHELGIYDRGRFFTVTGAGSGAISDRQEQLDALIAAMFPASSSNGHRPSARTVERAVCRVPQLAQIARRDGKPPKDDSRSGWDYYRCEAARCGLSEGEIEALIRHARRDDGVRDDYVKRTIANARAAVDAELAETNDAARHPPKRWGLGDDPIVTAELVGDTIVHLTLLSGKRPRIPDVDDLFHAAKHTRIISRAARTQFQKLTNDEAVKIAQQVISLCPAQAIDPCEEPREWVTEFIAHAGAEIPAAISKRPGWEVLEELVSVEETLRESRWDWARRAAIIRDIERNELWLPAGALRSKAGRGCRGRSSRRCCSRPGGDARRLTSASPPRAQGRRPLAVCTEVSTWGPLGDARGSPRSP